jgi:hypothetical protein
MMLIRMLTKTVGYLDSFSRFKKKENVEAVERLLGAHKEFHKFERAQLGMFFGSSFVSSQGSRHYNAAIRPVAREGREVEICRTELIKQR